MARSMRFKCFNCTHCCFFTTPNDYPILLKEETERLTELARKYGVKVRFKSLNNKFYLWVIDGFCPFYDIKNRRCRIHEDKPLSCKMFPLLLNIRTGEVSVSLMCDWVIKNFERIRSSNDVFKIFPQEMKAILRLFELISLKSTEGE